MILIQFIFKLATFDWWVWLIDLIVIWQGLNLFVHGSNSSPVDTFSYDHIDRTEEMARKIAENMDSRLRTVAHSALRQGLGEEKYKEATKIIGEAEADKLSKAYSELDEYKKWLENG